MKKDPSRGSVYGVFMIYDLSLPLDSRTPIYPGDPPFERELAQSMAEGKPYNVSELKMGAHTGTHVDAPFHMLREGGTISDLSLEALVGPAQVIEIANPCAITKEELKHNHIPTSARLLFKTRNSSFWEKKTFRKDYVYLDLEASEYLIEKKAQLVGIDSLSIEKYGSKDFPVHRSLLRKGTVILEGLDLARVVPGSYFLFCGPLLLSGSDGAPARAFLMNSDEVLPGHL